jgi:hypothetical protein
MGGRGDGDIRLQARLHRVARRMLCIRTATKVESRLLELAATSVRYRLVQRFACSLRNTALETSWTWRGRACAVEASVLSGPRSGILAIASCGRRDVFLRQSR